jgi:hypothetical protein
VALLFPPPEGEVVATPAVPLRGPLAAGVVMRDGKAVLNVRRFFAGGQTSLYVVVGRR